jgi:hypothetical protein
MIIDGILSSSNVTFDQPYIYIILLVVGGFLFLLQFKIMFFPTWKGRIIEFEDLSEENCKSCTGRKAGRTTIEIKVRTDEGEIIPAEVSSCTICLNKLRIGSRVGVTKMGSRNVASSIIQLTRGTAG